MKLEVKNRAKLKLQKISLDYNSNASKDDKDFNLEGYGRTPYIYIKGLDINVEDIISFKLHNDMLLPWLEIYFKDKSNKLIDDLFPIDNDIVSIFIRSKSELNFPIRMDFKIMEFNPVKKNSGNNNQIVYYIKGEINCDYLYSSPFLSINGTSYDALKKLADEAGLGFATNIDNTSDKMKWINPNNEIKDFIKKITDHSFINKSTFLFSFVDLYYNLNYIDLETQLQENISTFKNPMNGTDVFKAENNLSPLKLSNLIDFKGSNIYIDKYNLINESTKTNIHHGYKSWVLWYNRKNNEYKYELLDTISDVGDGTQIIMKDRPGNNNGLVNSCVDIQYLGKIDPDNVHENYLYAYIQNLKNSDFLSKVKMVISLPVPNFNLNRFQKVLVELYKTNELDSNDDQTQNPSKPKEFSKTQDHKLNQRLSGEWLITGINYNYTPNNGYSQEITLVKRELSAIYSKKS